MTFRSLALCAVGLLGLKGCTRPLLVDGAPCPCPPQTHECRAEICVLRGAEAPAPPPQIREPKVVADAADVVLPPSGGRCVDPGPAPLRPLSPDELSASIARLLGIPAPLISMDLGSHSAGTFRNQADRLRWEGPRVAIGLDFVAAAADSAVARIAQLVPCGSPPDGADTCVRAFIEGFSRKAYRRAPTVDELNILTVAFGGGQREGGLGEGIRRVIEIVLASPQFLYRLEPGEPQGPAGAPGVVWLSPDEVATRLAFFLTGEGPDELLRAAAENGRLRQPGELRGQALRLLADARAESMLMAFHDDWLGLPSVLTAEKNPKEAPGFTEGLRGKLLQSARQFVRMVIWREDKPLMAWLSPGPLFADAELGTFLDLSDARPGDLVAVSPRPPQQRFGALTLPAILAAQANGRLSAPVARGVHLSRQWLCTSLPAPPPSVNVTSPSDGKPGDTQRDRLEAHKSDPVCRSCHEYFDPMGLGLENFDGFGRWRSVEAGQSIDASGNVQGTRFEDLAGLAGVLRTSRKTSGCVVNHWFRYAFGREAEPEHDGCTLMALEAAFEQGGQKLRPLLLAIVQSDAFATRLAPGGRP